MAHFMSKFFGDYSKREIKRLMPQVNKVMELEAVYEKMSEKELKAQTEILKNRLIDGETIDQILPDAFAVCREAAWRVLNMKHFKVQIIGGIVLHQGRIAEMKTGEGKTLVATLPAYLNALTGEGVHIVTVNEYLAKRDSEWMGKLYKYLGLSVGLIMHDMEPENRKKAYEADITYCTNNELGFDYLRDNMVVYKENKVQRGHAFGIVDEVDSILIDEARTPLIISGKGDKTTELYSMAQKFAKTLTVHRCTEVDAKENMDAFFEESKIDYIVDEKAKTATLTHLGVIKAEKYFNLDNITAEENLTYQHHINQAIKANGVMRRDTDYVVQDGEVIIVDEFTGRLMYGRRYNEGLHQAIEAKEGVKIENESKTLATITFQNYFRLYGKLSGMTGTALTEEEEFREIYNLDVIEIPTNKELVRQDRPDVLFKTEKGKYEYLIERIAEVHATGQPILVGTVSVEKSEVLAKLLKKKGVAHNVLNAKNHDKEAEIVAQAGKFGAVTIATNMAGRGTDIMLGGNSEYMAKTEMRKQEFTEELIVEATGFGETDDQEILHARETFKKLNDEFKKEISIEADKVRSVGGLYIMGTERHESRRIDNQLRGRAGRQGDPGKSQFFLSTDDDLMRLFGGERMRSIMDRMNFDEAAPIENKLLSNMIEGSQQKVEERNFGIRKNVLQYDDVMNVQRQKIYEQRNSVLDGQDVHDSIIKMLEGTIDINVNMYMQGDMFENWNLAGLREFYNGWVIRDEKKYTFSEKELYDLDRKYVADMLLEDAMSVFEENEKLLPVETIREMERVYLLRNVDTFWMEHIDNMEQLKEGIRLRAYAQRDPVIEYRIEGSDMFDEMIEEIRQNTVKMMLVMPKKILEARNQEEALRRKQVAKVSATSSDGTAMKKAPVRTGKKPGVNDLCPCGSGKKYKKCCKDKE